MVYFLNLWHTPNLASILFKFSQILKGVDFSRWGRGERNYMRNGFSLSLLDFPSVGLLYLVLVQLTYIFSRNASNLSRLTPAFNKARNISFLGTRLLLLGPLKLLDFSLFSVVYCFLLFYSLLSPTFDIFFKICSTGCPVSANSRVIIMCL